MPAAYGLVVELLRAESGGAGDPRAESGAVDGSRAESGGVAPILKPAGSIQPIGNGPAQPGRL